MPIFRWSLSIYDKIYPGEGPDLGRLKKSTSSLAFLRVVLGISVGKLLAINQAKLVFFTALSTAEILLSIL